MATYYKLIEENFRTTRGMQWGEGVTREVSGESDLCVTGWIHFYLTPELAVLSKPIHADFAKDVVAEGVLEALGQMSADAILAKHDERYMPREVVEALKKQGRWQEGEASAKP